MLSRHRQYSQSATGRKHVKADQTPTQRHVYIVPSFQRIHHFHTYPTKLLQTHTNEDILVMFRTLNGSLHTTQATSKACHVVLRSKR